MKKIILKWQIWGIVFTFILGSLFHFIFGFSGKFKAIALIGAVNESTWEHLKIAFWPALFFLILEYFYLKKNKNFFLASLKTLYLIPISIVLLFYGYTLIIKDNLFADISIFLIAIIIGFGVGYGFLNSQKDYSKFNIFSIIFIIIIILAFSLFSFFPPHNFLFLDPVSNQYGII